MSENIRRIYLVVLSFVVLLTIASFCVSCGEKEKTKELDNVSLRLQWFHLAQFAGFYSAQDNGFYNEKKLSVQINPGGPDFSAITLVASGSETFGVWTADQILIAQSKGIPITMLAAIYREDPNVLMVKSGSGISSTKDFKGKRITTVFGRATEIVLRALLSKEGLTDKDVKIEPFPFNIQSFLEGKVDVSAAYSYDHPFQAQKAGQEVTLIRPADYGIKFYSDCIFARTDFIEKNPDTVQRFISASLEGWEYALANKDSAVGSVLKYSPQLDKESQTYMLNAADPLIRSENPSMLGLISPQSIQSMVEILQNQNLLPQKFDGSKSFTNTFVEGYYGKK